MLVASFSALALLGPSAQATIRPREADLIVTWAKLTSKHYVFDRNGGRITFEDVTKNVGRAPSRPTHTVFKLVAIGGDRVFKATARSIPALAPGKKLYGRASASFNFSSVPLGAYVAWVCADGLLEIAETNYRNNCRTVGFFFVVKQSWSGTLIGRGILGQGPGTDMVYENWDSNDASFTFGGIKHGIAYYAFHGTVDYDDTYGDPSGYCYYTGKYSFSTSNHVYGTLLLNYLSQRYSGYGWVDQLSYTIARACPPPALNRPGPEHPFFFNFAPFVGKYKPLPYGTTTLKGISYGTGSGYEEWVWHLE